MTHRIVILMSDTGGGHRACAEAIEEALNITYREAVQITQVDVLKDYAPYPFNRFPAWYPTMVGQGSRLWGLGFRLIDTTRWTRLLTSAAYPYVRPAFRRLVREHPADIYLSLHALLTMPAVRALGQDRPPFITVVSDLVSAHAFWFYPNVDKIIVPTEGACERARRSGVPAEKLKVIGLPVSQRFSAPPADKRQLRHELAWRTDLVTVLVVGGGEGMGPLYEIARQIASTASPDLRLQLVVVAGRNEELRNRLHAVNWGIPTHVYGFATNMPDLMRAADLIVTKAGPSSVMEAVNAGLPMVLSGALPQEEGNVRLVVENGAGLWAPGPEKVARAVRELVGSGPGPLANAAANARRLAQPNAALDIAAEIGRYLPHATC